MSELLPETPFEPIALLPEEDYPTDPEQDLLLAEDALDDEADSSVDLVVEVERPPIGRGYAFDPYVGFRRSASGHGALQTSGVDTLQTWVVKCLNTERGAHPIYSDDFGLERAFELIGQPGSEIEVADYEARVREALLYHPRITDVVDFTANYGPDRDYLLCGFTIVTDDDAPQALQVEIR